MSVTIREAVRDYGVIHIQTSHNTYVFSALTGDEIRGGTKADLEGKFVYTGDTSTNYYNGEKSLEEVPDKIIDQAREFGTIVKNVDGGWAKWGGRPEFSTSYIDINEMTIVAE